MTIEELTKIAESRIGKRTSEEAVRFLKKAKIIDETGYLDPRYFSKENVEENKRQKKPIKA